MDIKDIRVGMKVWIRCHVGSSHDKGVVIQLLDGDDGMMVRHGIDLVHRYTAGFLLFRGWTLWARVKMWLAGTIAQ